MYKSYFIIGWRNISKHKVLSFINIVGLSAGLTFFAFIALWVYDELGYDTFNTNYDRIGRVVRTRQTESGTSKSALTSAMMAQSLESNFPEIENVVRLKMRGNIVKYNEQQFYQDGMLLADPSLFETFSITLSRGNAQAVLSDPFTIVLTESTAKKYFGNDDPIGQILTIYMYDASGYGAAYKVTGVMPDPPKNSHFTFSMLVSFKTAEVGKPDILKDKEFNDADYYTYILLRQGTDPRLFSEKITRFYARQPGTMQQDMINKYSFSVQPLGDIHLYSHLQNEIQATGNINQLFLFSAIGIVILTVAGINYVNLSIAGSISRAREVGIKKVIGALKNQLVIQYLVEAVLITFIALAISLMFSVLLQPLFLQLTGKDLSPLSSPELLIFLAGVAALLGVLSGFYPALTLSGSRPLIILNGNYHPGKSGLSLRKSMLVVQFTITIVLVMCIIVINSQMNFVRQRDLGYDKDPLIFLRIHGNTDVINGFAGFKNELLTSPLIAEVSTSNTVPVTGLDMTEFETMDLNDRRIQVSAASFRTDSKYLSVFGIELLAGRNFSETGVRDSIQPMLINEATVQATGWKSPQAAIGKPITVDGINGEVIGVIRNFHFSSLHDKIESLIIYPVSQRFSRVTLRTNGSDEHATTAWLGQVWKKHFPSALLDIDFVDTQVGAQYRDEERFSNIVLYFSLVAIVIACLGLYGLISFEASRKLKEIGIRKVLGASLRSIVIMLSKQFLILVSLSAFVAIPIAWYAMSQWLESFAFRTSIAWWMFAVAGLMVLILAILTISFQAVKAALENPVKSLRSE
ncbi:MAG TPA: ABC transporter permease [Chryseolinea sp.]|nr:ABC transporter permease [Chryseolinea sp.]